MLQSLFIPVTSQFFSKLRLPHISRIENLMARPELIKIAEIVDLRDIRSTMKTEFPDIRPEGKEGLDTIAYNFGLQLNSAKKSSWLKSDAEQKAIGLLIIRGNFPSLNEEVLAFVQLELLKAVMTKFNLSADLVSRYCKTELRRVLRTNVGYYGETSQAAKALKKVFPNINSGGPDLS